MKKWVLSVICILVMTILLSPSLRAEIGFKGGLNFANQSWSAEGISLSMTSVQEPIFGAFYLARVGKYFAIQPEVIYSQKGTKYEILDESLKIRLSYLEIPVLVKFYVTPEGKAQPFLFAGPALGIKLSAKGIVDGESEDISDEYKGTDFGLVFGGGLEYDLGKALFIVDLRYSLGLANIIVEEESDIEATVKNKAFVVMIGFGF